MPQLPLPLTGLPPPSLGALALVAEPNLLAVVLLEAPSSFELGVCRVPPCYTHPLYVSNVRRPCRSPTVWPSRAWGAVEGREQLRTFISGISAAACNSQRLHGRCRLLLVSSCPLRRAEDSSSPGSTENPSPPRALSTLPHATSPTPPNRAEHVDGLRPTPPTGHSPPPDDGVSFRCGRQSSPLTSPAAAACWPTRVRCIRLRCAPTRVRTELRWNAAGGV